MMTDTTEVERFEPYTDEGNREGYGQMELCEGGDWVRVTDYDALAAKLAKVEAERDAAMRAVDENWITHQRVVAAEAALPAVYRLALEDAYWSREVTPTPTAAELMARINEGEKE